MFTGAAVALLSTVLPCQQMLGIPGSSDKRRIRARHGGRRLRRLWPETNGVAAIEEQTLNPCPPTPRDIFLGPPWALAIECSPTDQHLQGARLLEFLLQFPALRQASEAATTRTARKKAAD